MQAALDSLQSRHALSAAYTDYLDSSDYILSLQAMEGLLLVAPIDQVITGEWVVKGNGRYWRCKDCAVMTSCRYGTVLYQSKMKIKNWVLLAYCFTERHRTHASTVNEASLPQEGYVDRTLSTRTILRWFRYFRMLCRDDFKKNKSKIGGEGSILEGDESLFGQRSCKIVHNIDHSFSLLFIF